jgi:hypothetical protein
MPKYIKLFESFISEATTGPMTSFVDTKKIKWTEYQKTFKLCTKKLGKLMAILDAKAASDSGFNLVVMLTTADLTAIAALKAAGGRAAIEQSGVLADLPGGEPNYAFSARYLFTIQADGSAKIDSIGDIVDGIGASGSAGSAGSAGLAGSAGSAGNIADKMFGAASAGFDKAMQEAGVKQVAAYLRMINDPALQAAAGQDSSIKTLLDAQALPTATQAERDAKEKEIEPKVKAALIAKLTQVQAEFNAAQDPAAKDAVKAKALELNSLIQNYKPQYGAALNVGSAGSAGTAGTAGVAAK